MNHSVLARDLPTHEAVVAQARALQPILGKHAATAEALRRLPDPVNAALTNAGMFRLQTPKRFGGYGAGVRTVLEVGEALAEADASASWLVVLGATGSWMGARYSPPAQEEFFGVNPDARFAGSTHPGRAQRVPGGLSVSGRWPYASGAHHADWALLGAVLPGEPEEAMLCAMPAAELTLENTWRTVGMRGTGSDTWVGDDVFVPDDRAVSLGAIAEGDWPLPVDEPMYRLPSVPAVMVPLLAPLLGVGRAALRFVVDNAQTKPLAGTTIPRQRESVGLQIRIAEATMRLSTARLHAYDMAATLDAAAADGRTFGYAARAEFRARLGYAAQQVVDALSILVDAHGAGSFVESSQLQQYWRDANTAARHAGLQATVGYEVYGKSILGISERISSTV
ncbi:acyl-CoA dehydrogenase family protein [Mycobacterium sp. Aquia_213]|uniref:acyl-CoA dehydrogenase family protein n=1 Tax=Mycobacterium sp. Aquia_213 TaxID=2991728 RepID=UPI002271DB77|nr:acyl-CoA dehydrogenase family protein [Mycobacterium sp. Aquia_213]WAC89686.1 acyl-CoA dehydrogenase family protein [Mycobacterium sp. Aquia_213]